MSETTEARWHEILTDLDSERLWSGQQAEPFARMVRAAYAEPRLRQLHPWVGMWELHFSRCREIPFARDIPYIGALHGGRYYVDGPHRDSPRIAETDSAGAPAQARRLPQPSTAGVRRVGIGRERLRVLLHRHHISFQRTCTWKETRDPDADAKLDRIEEVTRRFPDRCS